MRREARQVEQSRLLRQNLLGQAVTELNFSVTGNRLHLVHPVERRV
uniref:PsiA protein n=1 Tax=Klebsiella pneumoniae TaxID=573 RepID=A0A8B0STU0_KLEPN|nr:PsiA protein [Klebsiella pneumoniae]